jgi:membrane-bound metal-dependent hydrolase YbcI (DUF457 family)
VADSPTYQGPPEKNCRQNAYNNKADFSKPSRMGFGTFSLLFGVLGNILGSLQAVALSSSGLKLMAFVSFVTWIWWFLTVLARELATQLAGSISSVVSHCLGRRLAATIFESGPMLYISRHFGRLLGVEIPETVVPLFGLGNLAASVFGY